MLRFFMCKSIYSYTLYILGLKCKRDCFKTKNKHKLLMIHPYIHKSLYEYGLPTARPSSNSKYSSSLFFWLIVCCFSMEESRLIQSIPFPLMDLEWT